MLAGVKLLDRFEPFFSFHAFFHLFLTLTLALLLAFRPPVSRLHGSFSFDKVRDSSYFGSISTR